MLAHAPDGHNPDTRVGDEDLIGCQKIFGGQWLLGGVDSLK